MNKVWFFGDSYVYGWGCHPGDEYYESKKLFDKRLFTQIVADKLEYTSVNKGYFGFTNDAIIKTIIKTLPEISKEDIIIIFDTHGVRNNIVWDGEDYYRSWPNQSYISTYEKDKFDIMYEMRTMLTDELKEYYTDYFTSLVNHLNSDGYKVLYKHTDDLMFYQEQKFHTIRKDNPSIDDGHLSFEGHSQLAYWIINKLQNNKQWI